MKVYINDTREIQNVGAVVERLSDGSVFSLDIDINDSKQPLSEIKAGFADIEKISIFRVDLNGEQQTVTYSNYTVVDRIQRKILEDRDVTIVTLKSSGSVQEKKNTETAESH